MASPIFVVGKEILKTDTQFPGEARVLDIRVRIAGLSRMLSGSIPISAQGADVVGDISVCHSERVSSMTSFVWERLNIMLPDLGKP